MSTKEIYGVQLIINDHTSSPTIVETEVKAVSLRRARKNAITKAENNADMAPALAGTSRNWVEANGVSTRIYFHEGGRYKIVVKAPHIDGPTVESVQAERALECANRAFKNVDELLEEYQWDDNEEIRSELIRHRDRVNRIINPGAESVEEESETQPEIKIDEQSIDTAVEERSTDWIVDRPSYEPEPDDLSAPFGTVKVDPPMTENSFEYGSSIYQWIIEKVGDYDYQKNQEFWDAALYKNGESLNSRRVRMRFQAVEAIEEFLKEALPEGVNISQYMK